MVSYTITFKKNLELSGILGKLANKFQKEECNTPRNSKLIPLLHYLFELFHL